MDKYEFRDRHESALSETLQELESEFPEVIEAARSGAAPTILLKCPKGHDLLGVVAEVQLNGELVLRSPAIPYGVVVATPSEVGGHPVKTQCREPGCDVVVGGGGFCTEHHEADAETRSDEIDWLKSSLKCPGRPGGPACPYDGNHSQATLLKLYAVAVGYGRKSIRLRV